MTHDEFRSLMKDAFEKALSIQDAKGKDYAGTGDALRVFKAQGEKLGITPLQAWGVLADKGWNAIISYARTGEEGSEPLDQRVADIINYAVFLLALSEEGKTTTIAFTYGPPTFSDQTSQRVAEMHERIHKQYEADVAPVLPRLRQELGLPPEPDQSVAEEDQIRHDAALAAESAAEAKDSDGCPILPVEASEAVSGPEARPREPYQLDTSPPTGDQRADPPMSDLDKARDEAWRVHRDSDPAYGLADPVPTLVPTSPLRRATTASHVHDFRYDGVCTFPGCRERSN